MSSSSDSKPRYGGGSTDSCVICHKSVYPVEKVTADDKIMHKACLRCGHCKKQLSLGNYASLNGTFYCKPHFKQLFALKGNYTDGFAATANADGTGKNAAPQTPSNENGPVVRESVSAAKSAEGSHASGPKSLHDRLNAYQSALRRSMSSELNTIKFKGSSENLGSKSNLSRPEASAHGDDKKGPRRLSVDLSGSAATGRQAYAAAAAGSTNNLSKSGATSTYNVNPAAQQHIQDLINSQAQEIKDLQAEVETLRAQSGDKASLEEQVHALKDTLAERDNEILNLKERIDQYQAQPAAE